MKLPQGITFQEFTLVLLEVIIFIILILTYTMHDSSTFNNLLNILIGLVLGHGVSNVGKSSSSG